jgi:NitT/TauT family transport system permease protein
MALRVNVATGLTWRPGSRPGGESGRGRPWLMFASILAAWELGSQIGLFDPFIFSRPSWWPAVFLSEVRAERLWWDLSATLEEFAVSYALAATTGVVIGLMAGWYRAFRQALEPVAWFFYNAPLVAFFPLLIVWLGLGSPTIIALGSLLAFFPIYVNTVSGMTTVSGLLVQCARSFGANTLRIFVHVAVPAAIPSIVAGLRLGVGRALIGVVIGELIGGSAGFGYRMSYAANRLDASLYFVALIMTTLIGLTLTNALRKLEDRSRKYQYA